MPWTRRRIWAPGQQADGQYTDGVFFSWVLPDVGGLDLQLAADSGRVTAAALIEFDALPDFLRDTIGFARIYSVTVDTPPRTVRIIGRQVPMAFPWLLDENNEPFLFAQSIARTEGVGPKGKDVLTGLPRYEFLRVWITFSTLNFRIYEDFNALMLDESSPTIGNFPDEATLARYVVRQNDPFDRAVSIPTGFLRRVNATGDFMVQAGSADPVAVGPTVPGPYVPEAVGRVEPGVDVIRIHKCLPEVPLKTILRTVGKVNSVEFDGFPPETLVCLAPRIRSYISPLGRVIYDIEHRFRFYARQQKTPAPVVDVGHNHLLTKVIRENKQALYDFRLHTVSGLPGGPRIYDAVDFYDLFRPDQ